MKDRIRLIFGVISLAVALFSAYAMAGTVRTVDITILFFGGVGFGAALTSYIQAHTKKKN